MTALSTIFAGGVVTAAMLRAVAPVAAVKAADQAYSSTTLGNDNDLALTLPAAGTYMFFGMLALTGDTAGSTEGGLAVALTAPAGAGGYYAGWGLAPTSTAANVDAARSFGSGSVIPFGLNGSTPVPAFISGAVTGTAAGTLQLQAAKNNSAGGTTTVKAASFLAAWQIA